MDLAYDFNGVYSYIGIYTSDDIYAVSAGVYRERATGTLYVHYCGEIIGGGYDDCFVSLTDSYKLWVPFFNGGTRDEDPEEYAQYEQAREEYEAEWDRFETLVDLDVGGYQNEKDYMYTIGEVRQQLMAE